MGTPVEPWSVERQRNPPSLALADFEAENALFALGRKLHWIRHFMRGISQLNAEHIQSRHASILNGILDICFAVENGYSDYDLVWQNRMLCLFSVYTQRGLISYHLVTIIRYCDYFCPGPKVVTYPFSTVSAKHTYSMNESVTVLRAKLDFP